MLNQETFAAWVNRVAIVNEQFADALHNAADIIAIHDPEAALSLYQAVDVTNNTVHAMRMSRPVLQQENATTETKSVVLVGSYCGLLTSYLLDLI